VLVSEVMLQQTQAARVVPVYLAFMEAFPDPATLAAAGPAGAIRAWSGLGYNRRAVRLAHAARQVVERHGGRVPADPVALRALPGVGDATARAVLAFAFGERVSVLDVNARRVLARLVVGRPAPPRLLGDLADRLVPEGRGFAWGQALMDLGALVCVARRPRCGRCPVAEACAWRREGFPAPDPGGDRRRGAPAQRFSGSDREGRGRLVEAVRRAPVPESSLALVAGWPQDPERARRVAAALEAEGLIARKGSLFVLP
jgi:A/G-specific adenine glycosylase